VSGTLAWHSKLKDVRSMEVLAAILPEHPPERKHIAAPADDSSNAVLARIRAKELDPASRKDRAGANELAP